MGTRSYLVQDGHSGERDQSVQAVYEQLEGENQSQTFVGGPKQCRITHRIDDKT